MDNGRDNKGLFTKGNTISTGRPRGAKDGATLLRAALAALEAAHPDGGQAWLEQQAKNHPKEFLGFIKAILPRDSKVTIEQEITVNDWIARMGRSA